MKPLPFGIPVEEGAEPSPFGRGQGEGTACPVFKTVD